MSDEAEFGLVMPFVTVASKGGPYDDDAFVAGYEAGLLDARLHYQRPEIVPLMLHSANLPQIDLIAMRRGYTVKRGPADDEWVMVDLHRAADNAAVPPVSGCDAKIRPFPNDTELTCDLEADHDKMHSAVVRDYAYKGSATTVTWDEADRRTFRGDWRPCTIPGCILPAGHHGRDAF